MDGTGHGKDLAPRLVGQARGDERARLQRRLHHQRALGQPGDDAVALREVQRQGGRAGREFADERTVRRDALGQHLVGTRVNEIQPRAQHGHRAGRAFQRAFVRGAVYALGQARHHHPALLAEMGGKGVRVLRALRAGVARAHDGQAARREAGQLAAHIKHQRRIGSLHQCGGVVGVAQRQHVAVAAAVPPVLGQGQAFREFR